LIGVTTELRVTGKYVASATNPYLAVSMIFHSPNGDLLWKVGGVRGRNPGSFLDPCDVVGLCVAINCIYVYMYYMLRVFACLRSAQRTCFQDGMYGQFAFFVNLFLLFVYSVSVL
jgi:hypothetical protein